MIETGKYGVVYLHSVGNVPATFSGTIEDIGDIGLSVTRVSTREAGKYEMFFVPWAEVRYVQQEAKRPR